MMIIKNVLTITMLFKIVALQLKTKALNKMRHIVIFMIIIIVIHF